MKILTGNLNINIIILNTKKSILMINENFIKTKISQGIYFEKLNINLYNEINLIKTMNVPLGNYITIKMDNDSPLIEDLSMFKYTLENELNEIIKHGGKNKEIQELINKRTESFIKENKYSTLYNTIYNETNENIGYLELNVKYE
jgi:hypothetical protein